MNKRVLLFAYASIAVACGSPAVNKSGIPAKANVNAANSAQYTSRENDYSFAQRDVDLAPLEEFVGKTATEMKLWDNKPVVRKLKSLMGADYEMMVNSWNIETSMKEFGDVLMLSGCERDNCSNNRYVIITSVSEGYVNVVHIGKESVREWKTRTSGDFDLPLPSPFAEELKAMMTRE